MRYVSPDVSSSVYNLHGLAHIWLGLHVAGGQIGLPLLILTFLFSRWSIGRPKYLTLINFCFTWVVYSVSYCLLLFADQADSNTTTPSNLCLAQAALIHGAPPMCSIAGLLMVVQLWLVQINVHRTDYRHTRSISDRCLNVIMILPPYFFFLAFTMLTLWYGMREEDLILSLNGAYCSSQSRDFSLIVPIFCAVVMACVIFVEGAIFYNWYKTRIEVDDIYAKYQPDDLAPIITKKYLQRRLSISLILRVSLFTIYAIAGLSACVVFVSNLKSPFPYMVEASLPLAAFFIFGTQKDVLEFWRSLILLLCSPNRWRKRSSSDRKKSEKPIERPCTRPPTHRSMSTDSLCAISCEAQPSSSRSSLDNQMCDPENTCTCACH